MSEGKIVHECLEWLAKHRIFAWRNNTGCLKINGRWIRYGHVGSSDIISVVPVVITAEMVGQTLGVFTAIECKTATGRQRKEQKLFQCMVERAGGVYVLARSEQDLAGLVRQCQNGMSASPKSQGSPTTTNSDSIGGGVKS